VKRSWDGPELDAAGPFEPPQARISRRASLLRGAAGLAGMLALVGCATSEADPLEPMAAREPEEEPGHTPEDPPPVVAGEALDGALLRRFYARRDFEPVWTARQAEARAFKAAVLRARDHGLDPELFQADLLQRMDSFPPDRRELLLTHAVLTYAEALAFGAVPPNRRKDQEALKPETVDVTEVLHKALDGPDPVSAIEALAPQTPSYKALREALQRHRGAARADRNRVNHLRVIEANLERQRWLPRELPADRVWVNVPDQQLVFYRNDRPVFVSRVVVGEPLPRKQSPEFSTVIEAALFNPPWIIPSDIVEADIRPMLKRDPLYLVKNNITMLPNGDAKQAPGPQAGLGAVMFEMPNRFDVYLHDTPDKEAFSRDNRRLSNGCIRVQNPLELAALLMDEPMEVISKKVATGDTLRTPLREPVPVFLLYHTALAAPGRDVEIRADFYSRDEALWQRLQKAAPEAERRRTGTMATVATRSLLASQPMRAPIAPTVARPTAQRRS
jgi:murein L,D-transpeptidase YcbB/YkuD